MFYAQFVLAKKGPLAKIWLAAHWEKKLTKAQICETDVPQAIEEVIRPKVKMALRTVGHLLVGIVRIYAKKTRYLLADTNETYLKMKVNFRNGFSFDTDLPLNANIDEDLDNLLDDCNITVPEFHDADYNEELIMANMSRLEDITIRDDTNFNAVFRMNEFADEGFGDEGALWQLEQLYGSIEPGSIRATPQPTPQPESIRIEGVRDVTANSLEFSGPGHAGQSILISETSGIRKDSIDFSDARNFNVKQEVVDQTMEMAQEQPTFQADVQDIQQPAGMFDSMIIPSREPQYQEPEPMDFDQAGYGIDEDGIEDPAVARQPTPESFALEPLDLETLEGNSKKKRQRKPRKLLIDDQTMITDDAFRAQQEDFQDTLRVVEMAPPSRKMLTCCISGDLAKLAIMPASSIFNRSLIAEYRSRLVPRVYDPNYTVHEISETPSSLSGSVAPQPWEDLDLNEHVEDPGPVARIVEDNFYDGVEDYYPQPDFPREATLEQIVDNSEHAPQPQDENIPDEEQWSNPFGASVSARGRLEAYGFGNSTIRKPYVEDEGKWSKRANHIVKMIKPLIESAGHADFSMITAHAKNRKQAAEQFYTLLTLVKSETIHVEQTEPYGDIRMTPGDRFHEETTPRETPTPAVDENEDPLSPKGQELEASLRTPQRAI